MRTTPFTTPVAELCTWPAVEAVDIPLPTLVSSDSDKGRLATEQQSDQSLEQVRSLAKKGEKGYGYEDKVLVQYTCDILGIATSGWWYPLVEECRY